MCEKLELVVSENNRPMTLGFALGRETRNTSLLLGNEQL